MAAVKPDIATANYEYFRKLVIDSRQSLEKAISADESTLNTKRQALVLYRKALRELNSALRVQPTKCPQDKRQEMENSKQTLRNHVNLVEERIARLQELLQNEPTTPTDSRPNIAARSNANSTNLPLAVKRSNPQISEKINKQCLDELLSTRVDTTDVTFADILGNEIAKRALEEAVIFPALNPTLFSGLREPCKGILLFGPPGNGKTLLAKAVATESRSSFFNISAATIMSKWVGEGEKMVRALFQLARNEQPSIIFIDEVDSLLSERTENENGASRRVKTEFLIQFDGCTSSSTDRIIVLGATNRPQELDDGILRRFPRRIYIDLPDQNARERLIWAVFQKNNTKIDIKSSELTALARLCEGYSYSDLTALCREAAMTPLRNLTRQQLEKASAIELRPIGFNDLKAATAVIRASSNPENTKKLKKFATDFAQS